MKQRREAKRNMVVGCEAASSRAGRMCGRCGSGPSLGLAGQKGSDWCCADEGPRMQDVDSDGDVQQVSIAHGSGRQRTRSRVAGGTSALKGIPRASARHRLEQAGTTGGPMGAAVVSKARGPACLFAARQHNARIECLASSPMYAVAAPRPRANGRAASILEHQGRRANEGGRTRWLPPTGRNLRSHAHPEARFGPPQPCALQRPSTPSHRGPFGSLPAKRPTHPLAY